MNHDIYIQNGVLVIISKIRKKLHRFNSLRIHSFLAYVLIGVLPLGVFAVIILGAYRDNSLNQKQIAVQNQGNMLANLILSASYLANVEQPDINAEIFALTEIYEGRIIIIDNNLKVVKDTYNLEQGKYLISDRVIQSLNGKQSIVNYDDDQLIEITLPITQSATKDILGSIIISYTTRDIFEVYSMLKTKMLIVILSMILFLGVLAFYLARKQTKPLKAVIRSIDHLSEGYLDEEVHINGYTEVEKISDSFNQMIGRLQKLESSRQEFVSNVSHELKTPITSVKVLAESLLSQEEVPNELYREFLVDISEEIERENKIINDLLSLVKLDKTAQDLHISSINVNELLEQILKRLKPIASKRNIEMILESFRPVIASVDEVKLSLAINNLIENAIKYNVEDGWVRVSLNADHKYFYIKVADSGIGIPEEAQGFIFERFYRVDKARSRETGGTGLGLAITKNAILMHRGAIKVYSKEGEGTTFTVRIPLNYIA